MLFKLLMSIFKDLEFKYIYFQSNIFFFIKAYFNLKYLIDLNYIDNNFYEI